jgi:precorrin-2 dehydrogenase/sirohydrochlorin ferrochelatase
MDAFPAFFPLSGRTVAIVGTGEAAEAKARLFENTPATLRRLEGDAALDALAYVGCVLAFVASHDEIWATAAAAAARAANVPVNVADRPALCDFTTPAIVDRGEVVAAIGTGGASPMLATMLRHDIEARMPQGVGRVAALFRLTQDEVRRALPDAHRRRAFLRAALNGPAGEAAQRDDMAAALTLLRAALASDAPVAGLVQFIDAAGPADLLTLRAARALAAADVLVCDPDCDPQVLSLARRDAERLGPQSVARLRDLTLQGLRVGRLTTGAAWRAEQGDLAAADVATEVLPIAG